MCGNMIDSNDVVKTETIVELKEILADDFSILVTSYLEDSQARIKKLQLAIQDADAAVIKAEAHSLKGSSLNLGARSLPELCSQLESCGNTESLEETPALFTKIEHEFLRVETALSQYAS